MATMHVAFNEGIKEKLKTFSDNRNRSMTSIINMALERLFEQQEEDPKRLEALATVLARKFSIPKLFDPWTFFVCLHNAAKNHPDYSSRDEWGPMVYLSSIDKTNKEVYIEVQEDLRTELGV